MISLRRSLPGHHFELARNGFASWEYCGKSDGRIEGPLSHGPIPAARLNVRGDKAARNAMLLEKGAERALEEGDISLKDYVKFKQAIELYRNVKARVQPAAALDNYWFYGRTGSGKSTCARARWGESLYLKSPDSEWFTGYDG